MKIDYRHLSEVDFGLFRNEEHSFGVFARYQGYGFRLVIIDLDLGDYGEVVFEKFLRTQDIDYCGNYLRKVARNNFNAKPWN